MAIPGWIPGNPAGAGTCRRQKATNPDTRPLPGQGAPRQTGSTGSHTKGAHVRVQSRPANSWPVLTVDRTVIDLRQGTPRGSQGPSLTLYIRRIIRRIGYDPMNGGRRYSIQSPNVSNLPPARSTLTPPITRMAEAENPSDRRIAAGRSQLVCGHARSHSGRGRGQAPRPANQARRRPGPQRPGAPASGLEPPPDRQAATRRLRCIM